MGKNEPRTQIPAPVLTAPDEPRPAPSSVKPMAASDIGDAADMMADLIGMTSLSGIPSGVSVAGQVPEYKRVAGRALTAGGELAAAYAQAAAELCGVADRQLVARVQAMRLLRLAIAHLEG